MIPPKWIHRNELEQMTGEELVAKAKELYQWLKAGSKAYRISYQNMLADATNVYLERFGRKLTAQELA
jgi:hypothetical protein